MIDLSQVTDFQWDSGNDRKIASHTTTGSLKQSKFSQIRDY